jgi:iron(III) transport system permease protein
VIYLQYRSAFDRSSAAALSLVLVAVALGLVVLELRARGTLPTYRAGPGTARPAEVVSLGRLRWPAVVFVTAVPAIAILVPAGVLGFWLSRGLSAGEQLTPRLVQATVSSLSASALGAGATLVFAIAVAWLVVRRPSAASRYVDRITQLGFALPGIVVALAYVFAQRRAGGFSVGALPWLIAAYVVLFLPQASGAVRSALAQVKPSTEEAARALGKPPGAVLRTVTMPLISPGVGAATALVFLTAMKELPATLMLSPLGFESLAMQVWSSVTEAYFARAATPALLLVLLSCVPLALLLRRVPGEAL